LHRLQESKQRQGDTAQAAVLMVAQVDTAAFLIAFLLQNIDCTSVEVVRSV
jgi:hypothetical protein